MNNENLKEKKVWTKIDSYEKLSIGLPNEEKLEIAKSALAGNFFYPHEETKTLDYAKNFLYWLKWIQSDDVSARLWWNWIKKEENDRVKDRDQYIQELWESIKKGKNKDIVAYFEKGGPWSQYEKHFFNWFMERYNIVSARDIFTNSRLVKFIHIPLSVITWLIAVAYLYFFRAQTCPWVCCSLSLILLFVTSAAISHASKLPLPFFIQSLIPRLGVTIGAGYLFLISAGGVMAVIFENKLPQIYLIILSFVLFIIVWSYMLQLVYRRVHPSPSGGDLLKRTAHMMLMAITYSIIGLYLTTPVLFSDIFYQSCGLNGSFHPQVQHYFIIASIALAIGVALQLFWDDHPVTEPL